MSMIRKYHSHTLQTNSHHREEEPHNSNNHIRKTIKVKQPALSSPSIQIAELEGHKVLNNKNYIANKEQTQNSHKIWSNNKQ